jgi:branched-chain amino acid transport system permease protein
MTPLLLISCLLGCAYVDEDQARLCRIALPALEPAGSRIAVERAEAAERGVRIVYRVTDASGLRREAFAECRFALGRPKDLEAIRTDRGEVPGATVYLLRRYYVDTPDGVAADPGPAQR